MKSYAEIAYDAGTPNGDTSWTELPIEERGICELIAAAVRAAVLEREGSPSRMSILDVQQHYEERLKASTDDHALLGAAAELMGHFFTDSDQIDDAIALARKMLAAIRGANADV